MLPVAPPNVSANTCDCVCSFQENKNAGQVGKLATTLCCAMALTNEGLQRGTGGGCESRCCVGVGNTCHLNSALQMLHNAGPISTWVAKHNISPVPHFSVCATVLKHLFGNMSAASLHPPGHSPALSTKPLLKALKGSRQGPRGHWDHTQKDASETMETLVHLIIHALQPPHVLFTGESESTLAGNECGHRSVCQIEPFLHLQIELKANTLEGCLQAHFAAEHLTGDNKWHCETCGCKVCATKTIVATKLPECLFVQLKRFQYDVGSMQAKKLNNKVQCNFAARLFTKLMLPTGHIPNGVASFLDQQHFHT